MLFGALPAGHPAQAQSLADALAAAYLNNPTLLAARAKLRGADEEVPQALANWRPDVSFTADAGFSQIENTRNTGSDVDQTRQPKGFGIEITQPLFRGGRTLAATSEAENNIRAERASLMSTEQTVLADAVSAYMNVFRDQAVLKLNINNEQVLKRQLEATRDRFEVGEITRTDVHQAEARLARAVADRIQSEGDLEASRANYENLIGEAPPAELALPPLPTNLPDDKADALKVASTKNPDVISAEFSRRAALDNADGVWGELLPELELTGSWTRSYQSAGECCQTTTQALTLNLTVPIYQQGAVYSRLREARQDAAQQALLIDQERRDAIEAAAAAWESLLTARARVKAFNAQIEANVVALEGVQREAAVGSRTVLDVLDAEQELLDSRVAHVRAQRDEVVTTYQ
ncbi:MAG: TolC family outer membrane protein, partial [Rhodospirillaceae bacterium]